MAIKEFQGEHRFLSNFWICPHGVEWEGVVYRSVEHAYQAAKTNVSSERAHIRRLETAGEAKKAGYRVTLQSGWDDLKIGVMYDLVLSKFTRDRVLRKQLLGTGEQKLVEGNWWGDTFWGVCRGKGRNVLGEILMQVRRELREGNHETGTDLRQLPETNDL